MTKTKDKNGQNVAYLKQKCHLVSLSSSLCNEREEILWGTENCLIATSLKHLKGKVLSFDIFESSDLWLVEWARFKFLAIWGIWWGCYWIKRLAHHLQGLPSGMGGAAPTGEFAPSSPSRRGDSLPGPWMVTPSCWASSSWSACVGVQLKSLWNHFRSENHSQSENHSRRLVPRNPTWWM